VYISDQRVWTENAKDDKVMFNKKSVSDMIV